MKSLLIKDTTQEERRRIVEESLGYTEGMCDGCQGGIADMYEDYIYGLKEIREITMEFQARYLSGQDAPGIRSCKE